MAQRTCSLPDCERKHRARGLCSTHYNQTHVVNGHPKQETACVVCSALIVRAPDPRRAPCCSLACRTILQHGGVADTPAYDWAQDAMRSARRAGCVTIDRVERLDVLERDAWICYLCEVDTSLATSPFDPASATVDHVIPLTKGGSHTLGNMRCACLGCNSRKRDTLAIAA